MKNSLIELKTDHVVCLRLSELLLFFFAWILNFYKVQIFSCDIIDFWMSSNNINREYENVCTWDEISVVVQKCHATTVLIITNLFCSFCWSPHDLTRKSRAQNNKNILLWTEHSMLIFFYFYPPLSHSSEWDVGFTCLITQKNKSTDKMRFWRTCNVEVYLPLLGTLNCHFQCLCFKLFTLFNDFHVLSLQSFNDN